MAGQMRKVYGLRGLPSGHAIQPSNSKRNLGQLRSLPKNEEDLEIPEFVHRKSGITASDDEGTDLNVEYTTPRDQIPGLIADNQNTPRKGSPLERGRTPRRSSQELVAAEILCSTPRQMRDSGVHRDNLARQSRKDILSLHSRATESRKQQNTSETPPKQEAGQTLTANGRTIPVMAHIPPAPSARSLKTANQDDLAEQTKPASTLRDELRGQMKGKWSHTPKTEDYVILGESADFHEAQRTSRAVIDINCDMALAGRPLCVSPHVVHYDSMHPKTYSRRRAQAVTLDRDGSFGSQRARLRSSRGQVLHPLPAPAGREPSAGQLLRELSVRTGSMPGGAAQSLSMSRTQTVGR